MVNQFQNERGGTESKVVLYSMDIIVKAFTITIECFYCHWKVHFPPTHQCLNNFKPTTKTTGKCFIFSPFFIHMMAAHTKKTVVIMYVCYWKKATNSKVYALPPAFTHPFLTNWLWYNFVLFFVSCISFFSPVVMLLLCRLRSWWNMEKVYLDIKIFLPSQQQNNNNIKQLF